MALNAILGAVGGLASTINGIFQGNKESNAKIDLAKEHEIFQQHLAGLNINQQFDLQSKLANAKTETERRAIVQNAVLQIKLKQLDNEGKTTNPAMFAILGLVALAVVALLIIKRKQ
jgi:hypothetical protein